MGDAHMEDLSSTTSGSSSLPPSSTPPTTTAKPAGTVLGGTTFGGPPTASSPLPPTTITTSISGNNGKTKKKKPKKKPENKEPQPPRVEKEKERPKKGDTGTDDLFDSEDEGTEDYKKGGYHPVKIGDVYKSNYRVVKKLGWGHFSTVWLAIDENHGGREVALKIVKSATHYKEAAEDEIHLLKTISDGDPESKHCVVTLFDSFLHHGPHGKHICMVFEKLGSNLLDLIKLHNYKGIPLPIVKCMAKQVLIGLDYLHTKCEIIHTDLKPENVLLDHLLRPDTTNWEDQFFDASSAAPTDTSDSTPTSNSNSNEVEDERQNRAGKIKWEPNSRVVNYASRSLTKVPIVKIADLGTACWTRKHFTDDVQTRQYRSPEVILGQKWDTTIDMWSLACMVFELTTGDLLFCPKKGDKYDKTDDHLALMIELLGKFPRSFLQKGSKADKYFNSKGELKYIRKLGPQWPLSDVLYEKYGFPREEAEKLAAFLLPMLHYDPDKRATARDSLNHPYMADVVLSL